MADPEKTGMTELERFYSGLEQGQADALRASDQQLDAVEEKDAEGTFRKGDALLLAHAAVPEGCFLEWCALRWPRHRSYAYAFMRVAELLAQHRARLVRAGVARSSLLELAKKPEMAEVVAAAYEAGPRPTVAKVKVMIGTARAVPGTDDVSSADVGGLRGLKLLHAAKRGHLRDFASRLERMIAAIEDALAAPRVLKGELAAAINMEARWAHAELRNLCAFIEPAPWDTSKPAPVPFPKGSGWDRTMRLLYELGGSEQWPRKEAMADWLRQAVLPLLEWAARDGAAPCDGAAAAEQEEPLSHESADCGPAAEEGAFPGVPAGAAEQPPPAAPEGDQEGHPLLSAASVATSASFLSFLRQRHLREGVPPEAVEDTCRSAAHALTSSLGELVSIGLLPARPPGAVARLAESIYRASQSAPPTVPVTLAGRAG